MNPSHRDASRRGYTTRNDPAGMDEINLGSLQRIADAVEKMASAAEKVASSWDNLRAAMESAERSEAFYRDLAARRLRSITSYKGALTRAKRGRR